MPKQNTYTPDSIIQGLLNSKLVYALIGFLLLICAGVGVGFNAVGHLSNQDNVLVQAIPNSNQAMIKFQSSDTAISVELATDETTWANGLMGRTQLDENKGMLFIFPNAEDRTFWMKNTLISLDIIFIDQDLHVINIHRQTKPNQTTELYPSEKPAKYVLEMNGGWSSRHNLNPGDTIQILTTN